MDNSVHKSISETTENVPNDSFRCGYFKDEEEFMLSHKFPMFLTHKMMHNDFVEKIESIDLSKVDNEQNLYLKEILNFVGEWLVEHILVEDAKYSIN